MMRYGLTSDFNFGQFLLRVVVMYNNKWLHDSAGDLAWLVYPKLLVTDTTAYLGRARLAYGRALRSSSEYFRSHWLCNLFKVTINIRTTVCEAVWFKTCGVC